MTWHFSSHYLYLGPVVLNLVVLAGPWVSLGAHLCVWPAYLDLHIFWFILSIMGRKRALELQEAEEAYEEGEL